MFKSVLVWCIAALFVARAVDGQTSTLVVTTTAPCVSGTASVPTGGAATLTCTFAGFAGTDVVDASAANAASFEIAKADGTAIYTIAATVFGATPAVTAANGDTATAAVAATTITITTTALPAAALDTGVTCEAKQVTISGSATDVKSTGVNLNTQCATTNAIALVVATTAPCVSGTDSVPTGGAATFTCTFTTLAATDIVDASAGNAASLEIAKADLTAIYTIAATEFGATPAVTAANSDTATAAVTATTIVISTTALPAAALDSGVTCIAKGITGGDLASPGVNLNTQCSGAGMNKMAGLFVALLVAMKTLLF